MGLRTLPASRAGRPACMRRIRPWRISRILQLILLVQSILFLQPKLLLQRTHPPHQCVDFTAGGQVERFGPKFDARARFLPPFAARIHEVGQRTNEGIAVGDARVGFFRAVDPRIIKPAKRLEIRHGAHRGTWARRLEPRCKGYGGVAQCIRPQQMQPMLRITDAPSRGGGALPETSPELGFALHGNRKKFIVSTRRKSPKVRAASTAAGPGVCMSSIHLRAAAAKRSADSINGAKVESRPMALPVCSAKLTVWPMARRRNYHFVHISHCFLLSNFKY